MARELEPLELENFERPLHGTAESSPNRLEDLCKSCKKRENRRTVVLASALVSWTVLVWLASLYFVQQADSHGPYARAIHFLYRGNKYLPAGDTRSEAYWIEQLHRTPSLKIIAAGDGFIRPLLCALCFAPFFLPGSWTVSSCTSFFGCLAIGLLSQYAEVAACLFAKDQDTLDTVLISLSFIFHWAANISPCVKLRTLGWVWSARICWTALPLFFLLHDFESEAISYDWYLVILVAVVQVVIFLLVSKRKADLSARHCRRDGRVARETCRVVWSLRAGAFLITCDAGVMCESKDIVENLGLGYLVTFSTILLMLMMLVVGGLFDPEDDDEETLRDLAFMARAQGKRIAFAGNVNPKASHCIVSFPGLYADEWDAAVRTLEVQAGSCSLACVFLPDQDSRLGIHVDNPFEIDQCWCRALYGRVPPSAYTCVVEPENMTEDELALKRREAEAMGQIFLVKETQDEEGWAMQKKDAEMEAQKRCEENNHLAPWGCKWFADWKMNVDEAVQRGQLLHVFFFAGKVGHGKLAWQELSDEWAVEQARENSGLGLSQTAEVAYLDMCGFHYEEHDVTGFYDFMERHRDNVTMLSA